MHRVEGLELGKVVAAGVRRKGEQTATEGCLSIPFLHGNVTRAYEIIVKGQDMLGRPIRRRAVDIEARVIQVIRPML